MGRFYHQLAALGFDSYDDYLASDHWAQVRAQYAKSSRPKRCHACRSPRYQLHHRTYKRLGEEELDDLVPLCRGCHKAVHAWLKRTRCGLWHAHERFQRPVKPKKRQKQKPKKAKKPKGKKQRYVPRPEMVRIKEQPIRFTDMSVKAKPRPNLSRKLSRKERRKLEPRREHEHRFEAIQEMRRQHRRAIRLGDSSLQGEVEAKMTLAGIRPR